MPTRRGRVEGFTPSSRGLHFANSWPEVPVTSIEVMQGLRIPIGNASNGMCGGMVYAARDHFESDTEPPADTTAPASGALYEYIGDRLMDSFELPRGPIRYYAWMAMPDTDARLGWIATLRVGIARRTVEDELPKVLAEIDSGHPSCLGLVCGRSLDPFDLGVNHQVLAWRYSLSGNRVVLWVYDPNQPDKDSARLRFDTTEPSDGIDIAFTGSSKEVRGFFRVGYEPAPPPRPS